MNAGLKSPPSIPQQQKLNPLQVNSILMNISSEGVMISSHGAKIQQKTIEHAKLTNRNTPITDFQIRPPIKYERPQKSKVLERPPFKTNEQVSHESQQQNQMERQKGYFDGKKFTLTLDLNTVLQQSDDVNRLLESQSLAKSFSPQRDNDVPSSNIFHSYIYKEAILKNEQHLQLLQDQNKISYPHPNNLQLQELFSEKQIVRNQSPSKTQSSKLMQNLEPLEENEILMNNQIDLSKLTPREKLSFLINNDNQVAQHGKKQLLFLKRQLDEQKQIFRPQSAQHKKSIAYYHPPISKPITSPQTTDGYKNITWIQLKQLEQEIQNNALWFSDDQHQEMLLEKVRNITARHKKTALQKHLDKYRDYYVHHVHISGKQIIKKIQTPEQFKDYWATIFQDRIIDQSMETYIEMAKAYIKIQLFSSFKIQ
ncbi:UNKNOWN [Stylonychia lemnae]|uniref:Uncharacterized protein n=1 Tax=Stylonychia lemnae TaxID=5949 RepID=A0A077ZUS3_STYLE|nr:UNKNOWN [Stylonychia lemnae]|eukprot:CDW73055.1 UNKNOWN [Stylonychia lemnae]